MIQIINEKEVNNFIISVRISVILVKLSNDIFYYIITEAERRI